MPDFLTVKEAARLTGKSSSSIRRVIYPIIRDDKHRDRQYIQPSPAEALRLRTNGENFAWRLSEELLRREVPIEATTEKGNSAASRRRSLGESGDLLAMLRSELEIATAYSQSGTAPLYWCGHGHDIPASVQALLETARAHGRTAYQWP